MKKKAYLIIYYAILLLLLVATWARTTLVPLPIRMFYLGLLFLPLLRYRVFLAPCLALFWTIAQLSFGYSLMPTEPYYYVGITLVFVVISIRRQKKYVHFPYPYLVLFFFYVLIINLVTNGTIEKVSYSFLLFLLLLLSVNDNLSEVAEMVGKAFILVSLVCSGLIIVHMNELTTSYSSDLDRVVTGSVNYSCTVLGIGAVLALSQSFNTKRSLWWKIVCFFTIVISLFALLIQASRGAILAIAVADVSIVLFQRMKFRYKMLALVLIGAFVYFLYQGAYLDLLITRIQSDDGTGTNRLIIWRDKLSSFYESSGFFQFLFGIGFEPTWRLGGAGKAYYGCHNDFLAFFLEYGLLGIILFFILILYPLFNCPKGSRFTIIPLLLFIVTDCFSLEPFTIGYPPIYFFLFYQYLLSASQKEISSQHSRSITAFMV